MFTNSSRQLRRIIEQSISMLKVSQNANTIQHLSFLPSKAKHIMVKMKSTQAFLHCECNTQLVVFILKEPQIVCLLSDRQRYFSFSTKKHTFQSTRKVKIHKKQQCVHLGVRETPHPRIYFSRENFNLHVDTKT